MDNPIVIPPATVTVALTRPQAIAIDRLAHIGRPFNSMAAERLAIAKSTFWFLINAGLLTDCNSTGGSTFKPDEKQYFKVTDLGHRSFNKWMEK